MILEAVGTEMRTVQPEEAGKPLLFALALY